MNNKVLPNSTKEQISAGSNWSTQTKVTRKQKKKNPSMVVQTELSRKKNKSQIAVQIVCLFWFHVVYFLFFLFKLDKDMSTLPTSKSYCYISNSSSIHYSFTDLEFHLANNCYWKSFEKCLLWPLKCLLKGNIILKYNCAADLAHWCLTE